MRHLLTTALTVTLLLPSPLLYGEDGGCPSVLPAIAQVSVLPPVLGEVSGLAASPTEPGVVWVHNDSGDLARVYALGVDGRVVHTVTLPVGWPIDWEAMSSGPSADAKGDHLFVADVGNNGLTRSSLLLHRFREPSLAPGSPPQSVAQDTITFEVIFPDGRRENFEAFAVDPVQGDLLFFSKNRFNESVLYMAPAPLSGHPVVLETRGVLALDRVTGADIAPDGGHLLLRTYETAYLWNRRLLESWPEALARAPCVVPVMQERQGEAIGFDLSGSGYWTLSEYSTAELFYYPFETTPR